MADKTETKKAKPVKKRKIRAEKYRSFHLQKKVRTAAPPVSSGPKLFKAAIKLLLRNWKPILGVVVIYGILNIILVQSFSGFDFQQTKAALSEVFGGQWGEFIGSVSLFAYLIGSVGSTNSEVAATYQFMLVLLISLATIWAVRHMASGEKVRIRDSFYNGMYPLVPFLLVFIVGALQTLPLVTGALLYNMVGPLTGAINGVEWMLWLVLLFLLAVLSFYMLSATVIGLYVACLPGVRPMAALRAGRELVRYRRWMVMRKILFLPFILIVLAAVIIVPTILLATPATGVIFFLLTLVALPIMHAYMYGLYKELLNEDQ